ncbi:MAG: hypothetical protein M3Z66_24210 [Chloroflexota bacterium]|nr:hypothetical protein [Chloroflexota bacterium]
MLKRSLIALVALILITSLVVNPGVAGGTPSSTPLAPHRSHLGFRAYLPQWLPSGFRKVYDPDITQYPVTAAKFFLRRYGARGHWVNVFEGRAGCCLDGVPSHRIGPTGLSVRRVAYFSNQGEQFGGVYLFWDQDHTYIAINSPNLSKQTLVRIARSVGPTSIGRSLTSSTRYHHDHRLGGHGQPPSLHQIGTSLLDEF